MIKGGHDERMADPARGRETMDFINGNQPRLKILNACSQSSHFVLNDEAKFDSDFQHGFRPARISVLSKLNFS